MSVDLGGVLERLRSANWDWTLAGCERLANGLGGELVERIPGRTSYRLDGAEDLSLYWDGERAESVEITLESYHDPHRLGPMEYEDKVDEYFRKYQAVVNLAKGTLGQPLLDDGAAAPLFPEDQEAVWLALWRLPNARLMIEQKHEDKELPIRLCIVVAPTE